MARKERFILVRDLRGANGSIGIETEKLQSDPLSLVVDLNGKTATERIMILYTSGGYNFYYEPVNWQNTETEFLDEVSKLINKKKRQRADGVA